MIAVLGLSATAKVILCKSCGELLLPVHSCILKFDAEGQEFAKKMRSLEQFIQAVKRTIFGNGMLF